MLTTFNSPALCALQSHLANKSDDGLSELLGCFNDSEKQDERRPSNHRLSKLEGEERKAYLRQRYMGSKGMHIA